MRRRRAPTSSVPRVERDELGERDDRDTMQRPMMVARTVWVIRIRQNILVVIRRSDDSRGQRATRAYGCPDISTGRAKRRSSPTAVSIGIALPMERSFSAGCRMGALAQNHVVDPFGN